MKDNWALRLLYNTRPGRGALKVLTRPGVSKLAGRYLDSRRSRWLIAPFIRRNGLDMAEYEPVEYESFNAFFTRQRRAELRRADMNPAHLISPCDGFLRVHGIDENCRLRIKGIEYTLAALLADAELARRYRGGHCLIFRLTPRHYHRYVHIDGGEVERRVALPGVLHCVRPIACARYPVYARNSREYALIRTENFGVIVQMEVGALLVGRICNHPGGGAVRRGEEKGYFEFGGSTIVLLFESGRIMPDARLERDEETEVRAGERIGLRKE